MKRLMRLKKTEHLRNLLAETEFNTAQLIQPLFAIDGISSAEEIPGLKGVLRQTPKEILKQVESDLEAGVRNFILFPVPGEKKSHDFDHSFSAGVVSDVKKRFGQDLHLWVDTCLCSSTDHGHCCVFHENGKVDLKETLKELSNAAVRFVEAGADGVSPSDMMDNRTKAIRKALDENGFSDHPIMSYSTKFASHFYGPFRHAADSAPKFGDRRSYQLDVRSRSEALEASRRCADEGADLLMVKPGMTAIDLIRPIHEATGRPVGAYQVSGEYAGLVLLAEKKLVDFDNALLETWHTFRRAGAAYVITYGARYAKNLGVKAP